jgi:hypothetical protein
MGAVATSFQAATTCPQCGGSTLSDDDRQRLREIAGDYTGIGVMDSDDAAFLRSLSERGESG